MKPQHIVKIVGYVLDGITDWVGVVPKLIASPITGLLAFLYLILAIGWGSVYFLVIFISLVVFISILNSINGSNVAIFNSKNVARSQLLGEMCPNMTEVKCSAYEDYFRRRFCDVRASERTSYERVQTIATVIDFLVELMPLITLFA